VKLTAGYEEECIVKMNDALCPLHRAVSTIFHTCYSYQKNECTMFKKKKQEIIIEGRPHPRIRSRRTVGNKTKNNNKYVLRMYVSTDLFRVNC